MHNIQLQHPELDGDTDARTVETEIAFDLLEAVVRSVTAVMLDALPTEGPEVLMMLGAEIEVAARQIEAVRPDWARLGIVVGAERRVTAILTMLGRERGPLA